MITRRAALLSLSASALAGSELRFTRIQGSGAGGSVLDLGEPGSFDAAWVACPTVLRVGAVFRMWYSSLYDSKMGSGGIGVAESLDGIRWKRLNGGRAVLEPASEGAFDDGQVMGPEVHFDGTLYRMWYAGMNRVWHRSGFGHYRIGLAVSDDGIHWRRENGGRPVLDIGPPGSPDEVQAGSPSIVKGPAGYRMWYAAWAPKPGHTVCTARSRDGISWTRERNGTPVSGLDPSGAYGPAVRAVNGSYVLLYMPLAAKQKGLYGAVSTNGTEWRMVSPTPLIAPGACDAFDEFLTGHAFLLAEQDRLLAWYTGYRREPGGVRGWKLRIGLAEAQIPS